MKKVEGYRAHADVCRSMPDRARSPQDKAMLMNMAATWDSLAAERQAQITRREHDLRDLKNCAPSAPHSAQGRAEDASDG
jgi:hypothetical protein